MGHSRWGDPRDQAESTDQVPGIDIELCRAVYTTTQP